jgi:NADH-quinone oxidoreductase subunit B
MLIDAILRLHEKIMHEPINDRRREQLEAAAAAGRGPAVAPGAMPSSWRFNKARKARWTQAVADGREEQLRIEDWMERHEQAVGGEHK